MRLSEVRGQRSALTQKQAFWNLLKAERWSLQATRGFTLIELMVVLAIVVLISLVILVSASRFNSAILLRSLAYEVGLSIREAQLYGVAVKAAPVPTACLVGNSTQFCASYGVHFQGTGDYVLYTDHDSNGIYNFDNSGGATFDGASNQCQPGFQGDCWVEKFAAQYGFTISNLCALSGSAVMCSSSCPAQFQSSSYSCSSNAVNSLDVSFHRPDPDALICINGSTNCPYTSAYIIVSAPGGSTRSVSVSLTGQIVVAGTCSDPNASTC